MEISICEQFTKCSLLKQAYKEISNITLEELREAVKDSDQTTTEQSSKSRVRYIIIIINKFY